MLNHDVVTTSDSPRLIGLTFDETFEFERLDHLSGLHDAGHVLWDPAAAQRAGPAQRWFELHDCAWLH